MRLAALLLACLVVATPAVADPSAGRTAARLTRCDTAAHLLRFTGDMRRLSRATTLLQMRFTLQLRDKATAAWVHVDAPTFDTWLSSAIGKRRYIYDKDVQVPASGGAYRSLVRFRWRAGDGRIVGHAQRVTRVCRVGDDRPNLKPTNVRQRPGSSPDTKTYVVRVANPGRGAASPFAVGLEVNGARQPDQAVAGLVAGGVTTVSFEAPRCTPGSTLTATVDPGGAVDESDEADNTLSLPCPAS